MTGRIMQSTEQFIYILSITKCYPLIYFASVLLAISKNGKMIFLGSKISDTSCQNPGQLPPYFVALL